MAGERKAKEVAMRRAVIVAASLLTLVPIRAAIAQTPDKQSSSPPPSPGYVEDQHPEWFKENYKYRPCPADVMFPNGRRACLGKP
jgi:hypothetical protein